MREEKWKKIVFYEKEQNSANLKIRLDYDRISQGDFFRFVVDSYIRNEPKMVELIAKAKKSLTTMGKKSIEDSVKDIHSGQELIKNLNLSEEEKENIFDLISSEEIDWEEE